MAGNRRQKKIKNNFVEEEKKEEAGNSLELNNIKNFKI